MFMLSPALKEVRGFLKILHDYFWRMYEPVLQIPYNLTNQSFYFQTGCDWIEA